MNKITCVALVAFAITSLSHAVPCANQTAHVDAQGVLRWDNNHQEVALLGVNYYTPFTVDYMRIKTNNHDHHAVMREDVAHFRRLGLNVMRIHCFDREFSNADGTFVDNEHVALLDELIAICAENGIYTVLTPIAWWGGTYAPGNIDGFSNHYPMPVMTSDPKVWQIQAKFLTQFANHINRYTKLRYADDPAILAFECINEPLYPKDHPDAAVTAYVNTLVDALRASGTTKPIYYNSWVNKNSAVGISKVNGVTGSYYPTGLVAGHALAGWQLGRIHASSLNPNAAIATKSKMIYEFDAADTAGAYMYPQLGRLFRHEGVQVAAMFQYDPMRIADKNLGWKTHYLNLIYTPEKAISIAIMAETFRQLPREIPFEIATEEALFPPFRVNAPHNLSEFVTDTHYYYTATPLTPPPSPTTLEHIWGCGNSSVVTVDGNGAYFLDRVAAGIWRLQLYPNIFEINDPYSGRTVTKRVVLPQARTISINLPDLGSKWYVTPYTPSANVSTKPTNSATLKPGDYIITAHSPTATQLATARAFDLPPYIAPTPEPTTSHFKIKIPTQGSTNADIPLTCESILVSNVTARMVHVETGATHTFPISLNNPCIPKKFLQAGHWGISFETQGYSGTQAFPSSSDDFTTWTRAPNAKATSIMPANTIPCKLCAFKQTASGKRTNTGAISITTSASTEKGSCAGVMLPLTGIPACSTPCALKLDVENRNSEVARFELGFRLPKGGFGANVTVNPGRHTIFISPDKIMSLWDGPISERPWEKIYELSILTGSWLFDPLSVPSHDIILHNLERIEVFPSYTLNLCDTPETWEFFDLPAALNQDFHVPACKMVTHDEQGRDAFRIYMSNFIEHECVSRTLTIASDSFTKAFPNSKIKNLILHIRGVYPQTDQLEIVLIQRNGAPWGKIIHLTPQWQDIIIPLEQLNYFKHWKVDPKLTNVPHDFSEASTLNLCFGRWLFKNTYTQPHAIEISSIRVSE